jgi:hypothetical protein
MPIEFEKKHECSYDMSLTRKNNNISKAIAFIHVQYLRRSLSDRVLFLSTLCSKND